MEAEELEIALDELELRLERLRALYEQYFLGIERIEPSVARKDVDRRIFALRREKIRNTGKRYKLQMVIQRYNTFQQYWGRICREIENGTYRRHLLRAERTVGPTELLTTAARRRFGKDRVARSEPPAQPELAPAGALGPGDPLPFGVVDHALPPAAEQLPGAGTGAGPAAMPSLTPAPLPRLSPQAPPKPPQRRPRHTPPMPFPMPPPEGAPVPPPAPARSTALPAAPRASLRPRPPLESLELDMDFMGDWDPAEAASRRGAGRDAREEPAARANGAHGPKPAPAATSASTPEPARGAPPPKPPRPLTVPVLSPPPEPVASTLPTPGMAARRTAVVPTPPAAAGRPAPAPMGPIAPSAARTAPAANALPPAVRRSPAPPNAPTADPAARSLDVLVAPTQSAAAAPAPATRRAAAPTAPPLEPAPPVGPAPPVAKAPPLAVEERQRAAAASAGRAEAASAARRTRAEAIEGGAAPLKPAAAAASKPAAPAKTAAPSTLNETRLLELHARLSDANRNANQPVVSLDGLTRSLRAAEAKLRAQHGNRRIEFDVVLKDGKPVVKPIVR